MFADLGTERQIGFGLGPIPLSKIKEYLRDDLDLDGEEYERALAIIRKMDDEYLSMVNSTAKPAKNSGQVAADDAAGVVRLFKNLEDDNDKRKRGRTKKQS